MREAILKKPIKAKRHRGLLQNFNFFFVELIKISRYTKNKPNLNGTGELKQLFWYISLKN
jgi:hypothetical protein